MSKGKIGFLVFLAVLAVLAITQPGTTVATVAGGLLGLLAVAHAIEVAVYFKLCKEAGGSLPGHLLNVFIFGYLHTKPLQDAAKS